MASEYRPYNECCLNFSTSYHELSVSRFWSVPENVSWMDKVQSTEPPLVLHLGVGTAQSWLFRQM